MVGGGLVLLFELAETLDCIFLLSITLADVGEVHIGVNHFNVNGVHLNQKLWFQKLREQVSPNGQGRHGQEEKTKVTPMEHKGHEADGEQEAEIVPADESKYLFHI